jgi:hypothetical protein
MLQGLVEHVSETIGNRNPIVYGKTSEFLNNSQLSRPVRPTSWLQFCATPNSPHRLLTVCVQAIDFMIDCRIALEFRISANFVGNFTG